MPGNHHWPGLTSATAGAVCLAMAITGCARPHATATPITVGSAFVLEVSGAHVADGYLMIQNSGAADQLTSVGASSGGAVLLRGPSRPGSAASSTVREMLIPAHSLVRLDPTGVHLVLTRLSPRREGSVIMLTLVFAHAGTLRVAAQVTNPQTDNSGYFGE